jgi:hypothetical protein
MKPKLVWSIASLVLGLLFSPCFSQARFLDDIAGNSPGYTKTYTYTVTQSGQVQPGGAPQYPGPDRYTQPRPTPQQPVRQQMAAPPVTHRQPVLQAQEIPQQRVTPKATTKRKAKKAGAVKAPTNRRLSVAAARSYQPNYGQAQQTSFYANPYQNQYTAYPNPAKPEPTRGLGIPPQRAMIKTT